MEVVPPEQFLEVLEERLRELGCSHLDAYLERLGSVPTLSQELRRFAERLTVGETYFFRHADHFRVFREIILEGQAERLARGGGPLRILSAGCASGEEPFTIAILCREALGEGASRAVEIVGADINPTMLKKAGNGRYSEWSLRDTSEAQRGTAFTKTGRDFILDEATRSMVRFEERNLLEDDPLFWVPERFDVIFCRNVLMYFSTEAIAATVSRFSKSLTPGGFLFLGPAETLRGISQAFHLRHTHDTFYYQSRESRERPVLEPALGEGWMETISRSSERIAALSGASERQASAPSAVLARPDSDLTAAMKLYGEERYDEAMKEIRASGQSDREAPEAWLLQAAVLVNQGKTEEAETICEQLLERDELSAGAHYLKALAREYRGDVAAAVEQNQVAVYLDPSFAMPHMHLGLLAKRQREYRTAAQEFHRAVVLLASEETARIILFGGGFSREALIRFCRDELKSCQEAG